MKIYRKSDVNHQGYKLEIETTDTTIRWKYYLKFYWKDTWEAEPVLDRTKTFEEFKYDHATFSGPDEAHIVYAFMDRYRKDTYQQHALDYDLRSQTDKDQVYGKQPVLLEITRHSLPNKSGVGLIQQLHNGNPVFVVCIPFKDSPVDDWTFITEADEVYVNGVQVADTIDIQYKKNLTELEQFLPSITLTRNMNDFTATLSPVKPGITLYFETTTGSLNKYRAVTDENGQCTVTLSNYEEGGKVKVGFKYYTGKDEIEV